MLRRLFVCMTVLGCLLLLVAGKVEAQVCSGYSSGQPSFTLLTPDQVGALGGVTTTLGIADSNGNTPSHKMTVAVTPAGIYLQALWNSNNAVLSSLTPQYSVDGGTRNPWFYASTSNGSTSLFISPSYIGHTLNFYLPASGTNGGTTQDRADVTVTAGSSSSIVYEDNVHSNIYIEATSGFSGPSMADACTQCQLHPYMCINKEHLPQQRWISVENTTSGETQPETAWNPGQKACETCAVSYTGTSPWISALPFDQIQFNVENQVVCDEFGIIFDNNDSLGSLVPLPEWAWFKGTVKQSTCKVATHDGAGGIQCDFINPAQSPTCTTRSWPADFQPISVFFPANMVPGYPNTALVPPFVVSGSLGIRWPNIAGNRFVFPFYDLAGVVSTLPPGLAAITKLNSFGWPTTSSKIVDCTNYDAGIQPWFSPLIP